MEKLKSANLTTVKSIALCLIVFLLFSINCTRKVRDINVVLISIDTLRPDHLGCYGYKRNTSPFIDEIAKDGVLFKNVISSSSWTAPAMASLFTSVNPSVHGVNHGVNKQGTIYNREVLSDSLATISSVLKEHGFFTMGFSSNLHMSKEMGFAKGFDVYKCTRFSNANRLNKVILKDKDKNFRKDKKFFLWIHYFDPHWPYSAQDPWIRRYNSNEKNFEDVDFKLKSDIFKDKYNLKNNKELLENLIDRYDSEINFLDRKISLLFKKLPIDENTLIIITADHGEEFLEHNDFTHGNNLYNQTVKIPLIIRLPASMNIKGISIEENVGIIDIFPTILDILNIPIELKLDGKSFLPLIENRKSSDKRIIVSELYREEANILSLIQGKWKYIHDYKENKAELYDLKMDRDEKINLIDKNPAIRSNMENQLKKYLESVKGRKIKPKVINPDEDTLKRLKSLGYVD